MTLEHPNTAAIPTVLSHGLTGGLSIETAQWHYAFKLSSRILTYRSLQVVAPARCANSQGKHHQRQKATFT
eukprot:383669-Amphidinium_carterae.1